jgi:hypothetical protein
MISKKKEQLLRSCMKKGECRKVLEKVLSLSEEKTRMTDK